MNQAKQTKDEKKAQRIADRKKYIDEVVGPAGTSLLDEDDAVQKFKFTQEEERLGIYINEVSNSLAVTTDCNTLISEVNTLINAGTLDRSAILDKLGKIKQRLIMAYDSRQANPQFAPVVMILNLVFLGLFLFFIIRYSLIPGQNNLENTAFVCLACAVWGGIGGIVDAFFAFYKHVSSQDFDKQYWPWYCFHPLLGLSLGAVIFLVFQAGWLAVGGTGLQETVSGNITSNTAPAISTGAIGATALPIAIAFLAGFRQQTAVDFITRIISSIFQKTEDTNKQK